jgi:hypothetical protein
MQQDEIGQTIVELENARCRALVARDLDALNRLVPNDVVHTHANGKTDDKAGYMLAVSEQIRFLSVSRDGLTVRIFGNVAIATGRLEQSIELTRTAQRIEMNVTTTQVWVHRGANWEQVSFQATNL